MVSKPIRTVIADEDPQFVSALTTYLRQIPEIQVVGTAADGPGAIEICADTLPDVAVISLQLPVIDGVRATQAILDANAQTGILTTSCTDADDYALQAIKYGARGYLRKNNAPEAIAHAIRAIYEGEVCIPSGLASLMLSEFDRLA